MKNDKNNSSSVPGRTNDPETFAKFASVKNFQDFLKDKENSVVMITLSLNGKGFLDTATFSLQLSQHTNAHDEFTIVVNDTAIDDFTGQVMKNSKDLLGENITIHFHHHGSIVQSFKGIIANIRNRKDEGGGHGRLYISGFAPSIILENGKDCQSYENKTLPEIIAEATTEYPQEAKVNTEGMINTKYKIPYVVQYKESDYRFISRLARRYGEFFYYNGTQLIFSNEAQNTVELSEGDDMMDVEFELMIKPQNFTYLSYDAEKAGTEQKKTQEVHLQDKVNPFQFAAIKASNKVFTKVPEMPYVAIPEQFRGDYLKDVVRREKESREQLMQVRGRSRNPKVRIGGFVKLKDINGKPMETYRVIDIKHYQSGDEYYNEFIAIPDVYIAYYYDEEALPRAEQQIARVTDNNDPKGLGRVRVQFIWQEKYQAQTPWIRVVQPHAGADKGFYFIPEIGEEVLVDFEDQNAERPFVIGANYNGKEYSPFYNQNNDIKAIQTRSGHRLIFTEEESILLSDKNGNTLRFDTQGKNIEISAPESISLCAGKDLNLSAGNNLVMDVANTAFFNVLQQMLVTTPFMKQLIADYFHTQAGKALINSDQEIKIEARETNVAGTEKLFMHSDEEATVNSKGVAQLHGEKRNNYSNKATDYETEKEEIKSKCMVKFRPHNKWQGEFGFDWLREGDSGQLGDTWFRKIMGRYYNETSFSTLFTDTNRWGYFKKEPNMYDRKLRLYTNLQINWKSVKGKPYLYPVPMLTLLKGNIATFNLKLEIKEKPKKLTFEFANDATTYLELNKTEITDIREGKYTLYNQLSIKCIKEFDDIQILYVKADDKICGAMKIHPNTSQFRKNINVVFITVGTNINGKIEYGFSYGNAKQVFKNHLNQALVIPNIVPSIILDCTSNDFKSRFCSRIGSKYLFTNSSNLKEYLERKLIEQCGNIYDNYYKLFFIGEEYITSEGNVNGFSYGNSKFGVYFKGHNESTIAHEIMHAMNLPHTFASVDEGTLLAKFTYEAGQTNNIMDYSHWPFFGNKPRITTYHWQWRVINSKILDLHRGMGFINRLKKWLNNF